MNNVYVDMIATGENIRRLRMKRGMSVRDLCDALGLASVQSVYKWERGITLPNLDNMIFLAAILDVRLDDLIITVGNNDAGFSSETGICNISKMKQDFNFARVGESCFILFAFLPALPASYDRITQVLRYFYDYFIEISEDPY